MVWGGCDSFREKAVSIPPLSAATPPGPSSSAAAERGSGKPPWWSRLVALLVVVTAVPVAVLVIPNTMSYVAAQAVSDLGLPPAQAAALVRANGLALPALLLAVPLGAVFARRFAVSAVLLAGLAAVLAGELAAELVGDFAGLAAVPMVGAVRIVEGLGAGVVLPATLVLAWRYGGRAGQPTPAGRAGRRPGPAGRSGPGVLIAAWAGILAAALLAAMPLALYGMPPPAAAPDGVPGLVPGLVPGGQVTGDWRAALQPYPWFAGTALAVAMLCGFLRGPAAPALRHNERTQLLLPVAPAAGFAFLAVVTTYGWSPGAQLLVAGLGLAGLLGLALVGSRDATAGTPLGFAVVALTVGLLGMPVTAPLAGLTSTYLGPGGVPPAPFAGAAAAALAGALMASRGRFAPARAAVLAGHGLAVAAALVLFATDTTAGAGSDPWPLLVPLILLGGGLGGALAASLRAAGLGSALFGLTLCFPAVLSGYLVVGPLQVHEVSTVVAAGGQAGDVVDALTDAFRGWLIVAAALTVLMAGAAAFAGRRRTGQPRERRTGQPREQSGEPNREKTGGHTAGG
jgi:hypothetical protein